MVHTASPRRLSAGSFCPSEEKQDVIRAKSDLDAHVAEMSEMPDPVIEKSE